MTTTLYAATSNAGKLREFAEAAAPAGIEVLPLPNLASMPEPVEDASTFTGNADLKAIAYSRLAPGLLVFADDSGLEVDALGGRPGVLSARFAASLNFAPETVGIEHKPQLTKDQRNNLCLLSLMHELNRFTEGRVPRAARFVCALSLAQDGEVLLRADGTVEGDITDAPRGSNGFGYDPLFLLRDRGLTLAELPSRDKWSISHRGNAFRNLIAKLRRNP